MSQLTSPLYLAVIILRYASRNEFLKITFRKISAEQKAEIFCSAEKHKLVLYMKKEKLPPIVFRNGKRLYLRPVAKEDLPRITRWINDPEVTHYLKVSFPLPLEAEEQWFEKLIENKDKDVVVAIVLKKTDALIGLTGLHRIDYRNGLATTGSVIGEKSCWSKGYGTEAKMILLEYAFNTLNLRKICSIVYDFNGRSKRCLQKCGYREEGRRKEHQYRNGAYRDEFLMAVFKKDFLPLWEKFHTTFFGKT